MSNDYQVRNPRMEARLERLGQGLAKELPKGWGFTLLLFSFGEDGSTFYISNAQRSDMIAALEECAGKLRASIQHDD